jgi:hypothetical protein
VELSSWRPAAAAAAGAPRRSRCRKAQRLHLLPGQPHCRRPLNHVTHGAHALQAQQEEHTTLVWIPVHLSSLCPPLAVPLLLMPQVSPAHPSCQPASQPAPPACRHSLAPTPLARLPQVGCVLQVPGIHGGSPLGQLLQEPGVAEDARDVDALQHSREGGAVQWREQYSKAALQ